MAKCIIKGIIFGPQERGISTSLDAGRLATFLVVIARSSAMLFSMGTSLCLVPGLLRSSVKCLAPILKDDGGRLWLALPPNRILWSAGVYGRSVLTGLTDLLASAMILAGVSQFGMS